MEEKNYNSWKDQVIDVEDYNEMWEDLRKGNISEKEWREFCDVLFEQELERNKDVLVRLKNR